MCVERRIFPQYSFIHDTLQLYIPEHELDAFINSGIPVYDNIDYIHCQTLGMTYDQFMEYLEQYNKEY